MVTGQGFGMSIGGCSRLCPVATGHSLVALSSLSVSIKDRSLHGPWLSHRLIIPSTYLLMGRKIKWWKGNSDREGIWYGY
jgi:hypothetical protein